MAKRREVSIAVALQGAIRGLPGAEKVRQSLAIAYWAEAVGPEAAASSIAETVRDGVLFVRTKSSVWSHELTLLKPQILKKLNARLGGVLIKDIVYRAKGIPKAPEEINLPDIPADEELEATRLTADEQHDLDIELGKVAEISQDELRHAVAHHLVRDKKIRRWRLEHGWKICRFCTTLVRKEGEICPICRLCR